ncbi:MAG: carboxypeptidase regulatory-like domain-containing protein [Pyrinomonadaceae bacterium]
MHRKYFFIFFAAVAALLLTSAAATTASAQIQRLRGQVTMTQADGKAAPVEKATVEIFRTDKAGNKETTTDKKGNFTFALDISGDYVLAVSAPNAKPKMIRAKAGTEEEYKLTLEAGDGRRLTKDEVMAAVSGKSDGGAATTSGSTTPVESASDKAKRAEIENKNKEISAKNAKIEQSNAIVARTYKAGNEALRAKRYDEAITLYDEGIAADPEQPALLTNKAVALTQRGVERYNTAKDDASRAAAKKDFTDASETSKKAYDMVNAETVGADPADKNRHTLSKNLAIFAKAEAMRLFVSKVDPTQIDAGLAAYDEYIAILTDPAKKLDAQLIRAKMLFDAGKSDLAAAAYQKILETNPDNVDATLYAGLALYGTGDTAKYQQAANFLQHFVDKAPDNHPMKASAVEVLTNLKDQQNVKPARSAGGRRRG